MYGLQILHGQFSGTQPLILDLKASTDSNLFKLFGGSFHILGPKYAREFNPWCTWTFLLLNGVSLCLAAGHLKIKF